MKQNLSRRWVLGALISGVALPSFAEAPLTSLLPRPRGATLKPDAAPKAETKAAPEARALISAAKLGGAVGYVVADAITGQVLEATQGDLPQPPASVAKTITTLYALEKLGLSHRFRTQILATGPIVAGKIQGDLVLVGSGDPTLDTDRLGDMAATLAAKGVRGISGRYLVYAGALPLIDRIDAEQPEFVGYNPALSGLNLNFNRVNFEWRRAGAGYNVGMDARAERFVPLVHMARVKVVQRDAPLFTYAAGQGTENWTVAATALGKAGSRWMPVRQPAAYTAEVFATLAQAQGITLPPAAMIATPPQGQAIVEHFSDDLPTVLREMLKFSTNLTAEVMGLSSSHAATLAASGAMMTAWATERMGLSAHFVDHSGLESGSRISAGDMVKALVAGRSGALPGLLKDIGMRDAKGKVIDGHPVHVLAKTGTLNFVSGLAGYVVPPNGRQLAFAIFCADVARRDALPMADREQPPGGPAWVKRAKTMQGNLISRWSAIYG